MPQQDLKAVFRGANPLGKKDRLIQFKSFTKYELKSTFAV